MMRFLVAAFAAVLLAVAGLLSATATVSSSRESPDAGLHGSWVKHSVQPDGRTMIVSVTIEPDGTFSGNTVVGSDVLWVFGGNWEMSGPDLVWHYTRSSRPLPSRIQTDVDRVIAITGSGLVLQSLVSGEQHTFTRVR